MEMLVSTEAKDVLCRQLGGESCVYIGLQNGRKSRIKR